MKKLFISALIAVLLLTGCSLVESEEVKLCKEANEVIAKYENAEISYDETRNQLREVAAKYCEKEQYEVCQSINMLKTHDENYQKTQDCDTGYYASSETAHKACLSMNAAIEEANGKVESAEHARITMIGMKCSEIIDKNK